MAAKKKTQKKASKAKKPNGNGPTSAAAIIKAGLQAGHKDETIEANVRKAFPDYAFLKGEGLHTFRRALSYYRRQLKAMK